MVLEAVTERDGIDSGLEQKQPREQPPQGQENGDGFFCVVLVEEAVLKGVREAVAGADHALLPLRSVARNARDGLSDVLGKIKQAAGIALVGKVAKSGLDGVAHVVNESLEGFERLAPGLFCLFVGHPLALREDEPVQALGCGGQFEELSRHCCVGRSRMAGDWSGDCIVARPRSSLASGSRLR